MKPDFGKFRIVLDQENELTDVIYNNKSLVDVLPTILKVTTEHDCRGNNFVNLVCAAEEIEFFK